MRTRALLCIAVATLIAVKACAQADIQKPCGSKPELLSDGRVRFTDCTGKSSVIDPDAKPATSTESSASSTGGSLPADGRLAQAYEQFAIANLQYEQQQLARNARVFSWQDISSKIMFFIVLLIVLTGLVLAGIQFRAASQIDISAGKEGLHLKTSIVGIVILAMSMVFLYLYLFFVYPIKGIG